MVLFGRLHKVEDDPLFIQDNEEFHGQIVSAVKKYSAHGGSAYVLLMVDCGEPIHHRVLMSKLQYTAYVKQHDLGSTLSDEEIVLATLVGQPILVKAESIKHLFNKVCYTQFRFLRLGV